MDARVPPAGKVIIGGADVSLSQIPMPIVYFDRAPSVDHTNGVIGITLTTMGYLPNGTESVVPIANVAAHLKCSIQAAVELRNAINSALLLAQPAIKV